MSNEQQNNYRENQYAFSSGMYAAVRPFITPYKKSGYDLEQIIHERMDIHRREQTAIPIVGFWGIGEKVAPDAIDLALMQDYVDVQNAIGQIHEPGAQVTILLADEHGIFNGYGRRGNVLERHQRIFPEATPSYLLQVKAILEANGIQTRWLSEVYREHSLALPNIDDPIDPATLAYQILMDEKLGPKYLEAARHNRRSNDPIRAAYHYIRERQQEWVIFPEHSMVFVNGGRNLAHKVMPEHALPILYSTKGPAWFQQAREAKGGENI